MTSRRSRALLPVVIVLGGIAVAIALVRLGPDTEAFVPERSVPTVLTQSVQSGPVQALVRSSGVTSPARDVTVFPEVTGRIVFVSERLVPGGRVNAGETLARIDPRDYELAVEQQRGLVRSAELELELEAARQEIAREEWKILGNGGEPSPLVLRESQRAVAEMNLESSKSGLARAELDLERATIRAPFNASVVEEAVDLGQVVGQQTAIARLFGTDQLRVTLSIRLEELALVELGDASGGGSSVIIRQRLGTGSEVERTGRVATLVDRVDPETRRAELLVLIEDPLDAAGQLPLLPGSNVDGEILGRTLDDVIKVPRESVYDGDTVWLVNASSRLERRTIETVWADDRFLYVRDGLAAGDDLVTSPLIAPVDGTRVQVVRDPAPAAAGEREES